MNARRTPIAVLRRHRSLRGGFTLVELMVAIGIIGILISILVPVVIHARKAAAINRTKQDLEAIRTALDAYKSDWGMYPPIAPLDPTANINNTDGKPMLTYDGAHALYTALMLRGNARMSRTTNSANAAVVGGGRSYGPYLQAEQVKSMSEPASLIPAGVTLTAGEHTLLCDSYGNPVLYVPASPLPLNYTKKGANPPPNQYLADSTNPAGQPTPFYDFHAVPAQIPAPPDSSTPTFAPFHNAKYSNGGLAEMRLLLGDTNSDGMIDPAAMPPEQAAATGPYILWTAGADGRFGINPGSDKSDDISNFELPAALRE